MQRNLKGGKQGSSGRCSRVRCQRAFARVEALAFFCAGRFPIKLTVALVQGAGQHVTWGYVSAQTHGEPRGQ